MFYRSIKQTRMAR